MALLMSAAASRNAEAETCFLLCVYDPERQTDALLN